MPRRPPLRPRHRGCDQPSRRHRHACRALPAAPCEGRTGPFVTFNTGGAAKKTAGENYLYLSEAEGRVTVKDDNGLVEATLPAPTGDTPRIMIASLAGDRLAVEVMGHDRAEVQARGPVLTGPASLFIGCRNHRPGLTKTLGGALIADVWLWPGRALLMPGDETDRTALTALSRFRLIAVTEGAAMMPCHARRASQVSRAAIIGSARA